MNTPRWRTDHRVRSVVGADNGVAKQVQHLRDRRSGGSAVLWKADGQNSSDGSAVTRGHAGRGDGPSGCAGMICCHNCPVSRVFQVSARVKASCERVQRSLTIVEPSTRTRTSHPSGQASSAQRAVCSRRCSVQSVPTTGGSNRAADRDPGLAMSAPLELGASGQTSKVRVAHDRSVTAAQRRWKPGRAAMRVTGR